MDDRARTPVRGFPPVSGQVDEAFGLSHDAWPGPAGQATEHDAAGYQASPAGQAVQYTASYSAEEDGDTHDLFDAPDPAATVPPGTPGGRRRNARGRRRFPRAAYLAASAVVVIGAGIAGYKYLYEHRANAPLSSTLTLPTTVPSNPNYVKALGKWQHIGTRSEDPKAATIDQLFPAQFELNGGSFVRTAANVTTSCSLAV